MPLLGSKRASRSASYLSTVFQQTVAVLTAGILAVALAVASLTGLVQRFQLDPLLVAVVVLALVAMVQALAGRALARQVNELTAALYRHHPSTDKGISVERVVQYADSSAQPWGSPAFSEVTMILGRSHSLLVICDGTVRYAWMDYPLPREEWVEADKVLGRPERKLRRIHARLNAPNLFTVEAPPCAMPAEVTLEVYGSPPPTVVAIEWLGS